MTDSSMCGMFVSGWYSKAETLASPFFNDRPGNEIDMLVIHNISLPAGQFGLPYIADLFQGCLDCSAHPDFFDLQGVEVSSHFLIHRDGRLRQFVATDKRAWHAGVSCYEGRENCNDFSIGIELEGCDEKPFTDQQYRQLAILSRDLISHYGILPERIVGHSDIAPGRKTDPGSCFDWSRYRKSLEL